MTDSAWSLRCRVVVSLAMSCSCRSGTYLAGIYVYHHGLTKDETFLVSSRTIGLESTRRRRRRRLVCGAAGKPPFRCHRDSVLSNHAIEVVSENQSRSALRCTDS